MAAKIHSQFNSIQMKNIESHKKAASHLEEAAKHHHEAAKHHEAGNHEKGHHSTIKAHGHTALAKEAQNDLLKNHTVADKAAAN